MCVQMISLTFFAFSDRSRDVAIATNFGVKSAKLAFPLSLVELAFQNRSEYRNADFKRLTGLYKFGELPSSNPGIYEAQMYTAGVDCYSRQSWKCVDRR